MSEQETSIRPEQPHDYPRVFAVNEAAFEQRDEAELVDAVRATASPLISLVAERDADVVGHILFSPVTIHGPDGTTAHASGLGPMAVLPELQGQGIGGRLISAGFEACRESGENVIVVLGHPEYYPRFGFEPAAAHGLRYKSEELDPYFFVVELVGGALEGISGDVEYHPAFEEA